MLTLSLTLLGGLALLLFGGEALVRGGARLAGGLGLSPAVIGLTVIGFGTSTPELVTSLKAAFAGSPGIALGNVIGSNIANILLILAVAVLILPMRPAVAPLRTDLVVLSLSSLLAAVVVLWGELGRGAGLVMLMGLAVYCTIALRAGKVEVPEAETLRAGSPWGALVVTVAGIAMTIWGASLLVDGALVLARLAGVSEAVIGLTLVAVGTSLPELAASTIAALRGQGAMALGNIIGSNIFNILGILGVTGLVIPLQVPPGLGALDVTAMLASAGALIALLLLGGIGRWAGVAFLGAYVAYVATMATGV